jgi:predicted MFS family arabinose efflux permease
MSTGLSRLQITVMAIAAGVCVANIYYNQPILNDIARSLHITETQAGNISVITQAGYGAGLFFLTPLGDKVNRKKLIILLQILLLVALVAMTFATSLAQVYIASIAIGLLSVSAQVILPLAASMTKENRGKTVAVIITGILIGILSARVISGFITEWLGWQYVYGISALMLVAVIGAMQYFLPDAPSDFKGSYGQLLSSTLLQLKRFPLLRQTALLGALNFGVFCSFWTTLTFHLSGAPFFYRTDIIGLFGLLAIAGALVAPVFGKLADKGDPARSRLITVGLVIVSVLLVKGMPHSLASFIIAVLLLDIGVQATQVTNIATIYTLDQTANSRINTVYMTSYFIGGAVGTLAGVICWKAGGWPMVTAQLLLWSLLAMITVITGNRQIARAKNKPLPKI